jgi:hypothetical protein
MFFLFEISKAGNKKKTGEERNIKKGKSIVNGKQLLSSDLIFSAVVQENPSYGDFYDPLQDRPPPELARVIAPQSFRVLFRRCFVEIAPKATAITRQKSAQRNLLASRKPVRRMPKTSKKRASPRSLQFAAARKMKDGNMCNL